MIIGGGNVAMDTARSLARLQKQTHGEVRITVSALEDFDHFIADTEEVVESREEAITILDSRGPQACVVEDGRLVGLSTLKVISIFDDQHRFAPRYDESDRQVHEGEVIIEAIGQMTDTDLLGEELTEALAWNRGRLQVDDRALVIGHKREIILFYKIDNIIFRVNIDTTSKLQVDDDGHTSEPWLWAGGDMVHGPDVVHAVADGHRAARSINEYLTMGIRQEDGK